MIYSINKIGQKKATYKLPFLLQVIGSSFLI